MPADRRYWFPAKRYGWGWGPPLVWQGWTVLIAYFVLLALAAWRFPPSPDPLMFIVCAILLSAVLVVICRLTGEPPRWRWGDRDR